MYLDDGVSRDNAPTNLPQYKHREQPDIHNPDDADSANEAKSKYREVKISQVPMPYDYPHPSAN